tara:strand:+ start:151 stop:927 length:777 start_codon:yes stop_codon:yes gene_type:complete
MKVKLTEQQFRRVILKEDWPGMDIFDSGPVEELNIVQPRGEIEAFLVKAGKALGIIDVMVRGGFNRVKNDIEKLVTEGKLNMDKPLKKLMIGTHGSPWDAGCGRFTFDVDDEDDAESYNFLRYLSQFLTKSTKVFFTGCYSGTNPIFLSKMAKALGVEKVTASTGIYFPALNKVLDGSFITCKATSNNDIGSNEGEVETPMGWVKWTPEEKKHMGDILRRTQGKGTDEVKKYKEERLEEKLKTMGCTLSSSNPYGSWI